MRYQRNVAITAQCEPPILTGGLEDFKFAFMGGGGLGNFQNNQGGTLSWGGGEK